MFELFVKYLQLQSITQFNNHRHRRPVDNKPFMGEKVEKL